MGRPGPGRHRSVTNDQLGFRRDRRRWSPDSSCWGSLLASAADTGDAFSLLLSHAPTGDRVPRHIHDTVEEAFTSSTASTASTAVSRLGLLRPATSSSSPPRPAQLRRRPRSRAQAHHRRPRRNRELLQRPRQRRRPCNDHPPPRREVPRLTPIPPGWRDHLGTGQTSSQRVSVEDCL